MNTSKRNDIEAPSLYGLILSGGKSRRMKQNKSLLQYHGKIQVAHAFDLLSAHCEKVFISNREDQAHLHAEFPQIHDMYQDMGPPGGILSAMTVFSEVAWFVLANDLPYVDAKTIRTLIQHRDPSKAAVAYQNSRRSFPEPLCTIYEPKMKTRLLELLDSGCRVFRKVLENHDIQILDPPEEFTLTNVNYPEEYTQAVEFLSCAQAQGSKLKYAEAHVKGSSTRLKAQVR